MRAWIEIVLKTSLAKVLYVALFMRAWIEIGDKSQCMLSVSGRPLHEGVD